MIVTACLDRRSLVPKSESGIVVAAFHILQFDGGAELDGPSDRFQVGQGLKRMVNLGLRADSTNPLQAMQHLDRSSRGLHAASSRIYGPIVAEGLYRTIVEKGDRPLRPGSDDRDAADLAAEYDAVGNDGGISAFASRSYSALGAARGSGEH